jgi:hypothetical protein
MAALGYGLSKRDVVHNSRQINTGVPHGWNPSGSSLASARS